MIAKQILYLGLDPTYYQANGQITHWPIIQIVPRPLTDLTLYQVLKEFACYSHVIVTSKSTVVILKDYLSQMGISLDTWAAKTTLAVGKITAKHLYACGITPAKIAQEETAEGLVRELEQLSLDKAHVFWPHSAQARSVIKDFLIDHHICHTTCALYDSKPCLPNVLPDLELFDELVFTSPSTVEAFLTIFKQFPKHACLTPLGPITASYLENLLTS